MKLNLLLKELRLAAHPNLIIFACMGPLILVPAYPYTMVFLFCCIGNFVNLMYARETNDIYYTALLSIPKAAVVTSKWQVLWFSEFIQLGITLFFALIRNLLFTTPNPVGLQSNLALFAVGLLLYSLFNLIFLPTYFKTAIRVGRAFLAGIIPTTLLAISFEVLAHFPQLAWLSAPTGRALLPQTIFFISSCLIYYLTLWFAKRLASRFFEQVDL